LIQLTTTLNTAIADTA